MVGGIQNRPQADRAAQVGAANHADATAEAGALNGRQVRQEPAQPRAQGFLTRIFNQIRTLANRLFGARQQDAPVRSPAREVSANRQSNVAEHVRAADAPSLGTISEAPEEEEMEPAEMAAVAAGRVNKLKESLRELESKLTQCKEKILENHDDIVAGSPERKDHRSKTEQEKNALGKGNDELRGKQEHLYEEKLRLENDISALKTNLEEADRALADATQRLANANKAAHQDQLPEMATAAAKQAGKLYNASSLWSGLSENARHDLQVKQKDDPWGENGDHRNYLNSWNANRTREASANCDIFKQFVEEHKVVLEAAIASIDPGRDGSGRTNLLDRAIKNPSAFSESDFQKLMEVTSGNTDFNEHKITYIASGPIPYNLKQLLENFEKGIKP